MQDKLIKRVLARMKKDLPSLGECPDEAELACFEEGTLDEKERERIEEHLVYCSKCCDYLVTLNRVINLSEEENLPEIPSEQLEKVSALVRDRRKDVHTKDVKSYLTAIVQSIKEFFIFDWIAQPIPVAVRSGAVALLVLLMVSTTFIYFKQGSEIGLQMEIIGKTSAIATRGSKGGDTFEKIVKDGDTLFSDDYCRINFELDRDAYAYVLYYDSTGDLHQLFPDPDIQIPQKVKGNKTYTIPEGENQWFQLDEQSGRETVFILASNKPISDFNETIAVLDGKNLDDILKVFKNEATIMETLSFNHR